MDTTSSSLRFSLIVPTIGRVKEIERLFHSLVAQTYQNFEVIVVDQSGGDDLNDLVAHFSGLFPLRHLRLETRGASRARNAGLPLTTGDIIAWPDDDCFYPPDLLAKVQEVFTQCLDWEGLIGNSVDEKGIVHDRRHIPRQRRLSRVDLLRVGVEYCLFLRKTIIDQVGGFSDLFGPGAGTNWWAGEAAEYELRLLRSGSSLGFSPELRVHHPNQGVFEFSPEAIRKTYHYAQGMGAAIRKNQQGKGGTPSWFIGYYSLLYLRAALFSLLRGHSRQARLHLLRLTGVFIGWWTYRNVRGEF